MFLAVLKMHRKLNFLRMFRLLLKESSNGLLLPYRSSPRVGNTKFGVIPTRPLSRCLSKNTVPPRHHFQTGSFSARSHRRPQLVPRDSHVPDGAHSRDCFSEDRRGAVYAMPFALGGTQWRRTTLCWLGDSFPKGGSLAGLASPAVARSSKSWMACRFHCFHSWGYRVAQGNFPPAPPDNPKTVTKKRSKPNQCLTTWCSPCNYLRISS